MEELWVVCGFTCRKWSYAIGSNMLTRYRGLGQFNTAIVVPSTSSRNCSRKRGQWKYRQFLSESRTVQKSNRIPRQLESAKVGDKAGELWKSQQRLLQSIKPYSFLSQKSKRTKLWPDQCWITFSYYITSPVSVSHKQNKIGYISVPCDFNYLQWNSCTFHWTKACRIAIKFLAAGQERESARQTHWYEMGP